VEREGGREGREKRITVAGLETSRGVARWIRESRKRTMRGGGGEATPRRALLPSPALPPSGAFGGRQCATLAKAIATPRPQPSL
jgi:hypothetical protein